jgi:hypothetical protein
MKKITTIFKTMLFAVVVVVMVQSCIPTTPTGGNPTPNPQSNIIYKVFDDSLYPDISNNIFIDFDSIIPIEIELWKSSFLPSSCTISRNDTTVKFLQKNIGLYGNFDPSYSIATNVKVDKLSTVWVDNRFAILGVGPLYKVDDNGWNYNTEIDKLTYIVFKAPLLSNPTKFAYGWLQLEIITNADSYRSARVVYIKDGAIETNVGEIYVGYH